MSLWRSSAEPVGVKNSDQELDLRLRKAARRRASTFSGRYGREHRAFGCLAWGRGHAEPPGLDLSASDSASSTFGSGGRCPRGPSRGCDWPVSGRRPARAKPQVTGVIGVSDPFSLGLGAAALGSYQVTRPRCRVCGR